MAQFVAEFRRDNKKFRYYPIKTILFI